MKPLVFSDTYLPNKFYFGPCMALYYRNVVPRSVSFKLLKFLYIPDFSEIKDILSSDIENEVYKSPNR